MTGPEIHQSQVSEDHVGIDRSGLIEQWRNAPYEVINYPAGTITDSQGILLYEYKEGARLMMLEQEVMDTCQFPWAQSTVNRAFSALNLNHSRSSPPQTKYDVRALERGFGMGIVASRIMNHLTITRGEYTCIELNEQVANYADKDWRSQQNRIARHWATSIRGGRSKDAKYIPMNIIRGDAFEETEKLAEEGRKFDIIISDTYPLSDEEKSVNDLLDLEQLIQCLDPNGVFAFFGFHTGSEGGMNEKQRNMIDKYFDSTRTTWVHVSPPPDYKYFNPPNGPIRRLPVIICTQPIFDRFNPS